METSSRQLLPPLERSPPAHGTCTAGTVPSGLRTDKIYLLTTRHTIVFKTVPREQRVKIDYAKLRELCLSATHAPDNCTDDEESREKRHQKFMSSYQLLLRSSPEKATPTTGDNPACMKRRHTCSFPLEPSRDVSTYTKIIHGPNPRTQAVPDMGTRLAAILRIIRKLPLQRDVSEVKELSQYLAQFTSLLPNMTTNVLVGMAARCLLETVPKEGFSLPGKGGVYLIVKGCVEKKLKDESTQQITSIKLYPGDYFGDMEEHFITKPSYPMYVTSTKCMLMRITYFDYQRVLQNCQAEERKVRLELINSCSVLRGISPAVISAVAKGIQWETIPRNSCILCEGDYIKRVGFIESGRCQATMLVPGTSAPTQVMVGELGPGTCVGEGLLRGVERQPYRVTTTTQVKIGWVSSAIITMNEVKKLLPVDRALCIPVPSKELLRQKYAHKLMDQHWRKIKNDIVREVRTEQRTPDSH